MWQTPVSFPLTPETRSNTWESGLGAGPYSRRARRRRALQPVHQNTELQSGNPRLAGQHAFSVYYGNLCTNICFPHSILYELSEVSVPLDLVCWKLCHKVLGYPGAWSTLIPPGISHHSNLERKTWKTGNIIFPLLPEHPPCGQQSPQH